MIPDLDDERLVASDYVPIRSALTAAAEIREELAELAIWEIRISYDGVTVIEMLFEADLDRAADLLRLTAWHQTLSVASYSGVWRGAKIQLAYPKPSRVMRAWLRITGRLK